MRSPTRVPSQPSIFTDHPHPLSFRLSGAASVCKLYPVAVLPNSSFLKPRRVAAAFPRLLRLRPGAAGRGRRGRAFARTAFWEQLYDLLTVLLHQAGVALWLSTFPEVRCGVHVKCGGRCDDGGEMKQKRKGAERKEWTRVGVVGMGRTPERSDADPSLARGNRCLIQKLRRLESVGSSPLLFHLPSCAVRTHLSLLPSFWAITGCLLHQWQAKLYSKGRRPSS